MHRPGPHELLDTNTRRLNPKPPIGRAAETDEAEEDELPVNEAAVWFLKTQPQTLNLESLRPKPTKEVFGFRPQGGG